MLKIVVFPCLSIVWQYRLLVIGGWMRWQQGVGEDLEEEEILTQYEANEDSAAEQLQLNGAAKESYKDPRLVGWEFKIVRANRNLFRDPAVLQRLCAEETEAGWILLEKLDDRRVRFKRPMALREIVKSEFLSHDPYRCHYGPVCHPLTWLGVTIATLVAIILPAYLGYALVSHKIASSRPTQMPAIFPPLEQTPSP